MKQCQDMPIKVPQQQFITTGAQNKLNAYQANAVQYKKQANSSHGQIVALVPRSLMEDLCNY